MTEQVVKKSDREDDAMVYWKVVLGQYYFGIRYAAAFFEGFVVKTDRYQSAFLSQSLGK